jgi:membrane protein DedA with SNARE-associated domain
MIFLTRFALTPLATPVSLVAGASRLQLSTFLLWDVLGEGIFVVGNLALGRFLSARGLSIGPFLAIAAAVALLGYGATCLQAHSLTSGATAPRQM